MGAYVLKITILDHKLERIHACEQSVHKALKELGMKAIVTQVCEPPYLSRLDVWERLPALDIDGRIWSRKSRKAFKKEEVVSLLKKYYLTTQNQE